MGLAAHLYSRFAAFGAGFSAGFGLFIFLIQRRPLDAFPVTALLFFGLLFGGGYLAQLGFCNLFPAACPKCGARSAMPALRQPFVYGCRSCGADSNGFAYMNVELLASMPTPEQQAKRELGFSWLFLVVGLGLIGIAVWLGSDSIQLLREGVSTDAKVTRITEERTRDSKGDDQTSYTAYIDYRVGNTTFTMTSGWSEKPGTASLLSRYGLHDQLKVIYLPHEPTHARIHSVRELFFAPMLLGGVGLLFALFGSIMVRQRLRRRPKLEL